jgi:hypothetical protein
VLLRNRTPPIATVPEQAAAGCEHLPGAALAVLSWLSGARIDFVLVGAVARQLRGEHGAAGPVAIVPAPYGRNLDRLVQALGVQRARERTAVQAGAGAPPAGAPLKLKAELLVRPRRLQLVLGAHPLDVEGRPDSAPSYQALLYEAVRMQVSAATAVEVAAPEDIEFYEQVHRTGVAPQISVARL